MTSEMQVACEHSIPCTWPSPGASLGEVHNARHGRWIDAAQRSAAVMAAATWKEFTVLSSRVMSRSLLVH